MTRDKSNALADTIQKNLANRGVGCHFLLQGEVKTVKASFKKKSKVGVAHLFDFMILYNYTNQDSVVILRR